MDLKVLRTFIQVAQTGTLSKASEHLRLAQPALSRHIKLLESETGLRLFERSPRGMRLTSAGEKLLERISGLVRQIDQTIIDVGSGESDITGQVVLGVLAGSNGAFASRIIRRALDFPGVSLRLIEGSSRRLIDLLNRGEVDLALLHALATDSEVNTTTLFDEDLVAVGPLGGKLEKNKPIRLNQLRRYDLIMTGQNHGIRLIVDEAAKKLNIDLKVAYEVDSFALLKDLVANGLGYSILPESAISGIERLNLFAVAPLAKPRLSRRIVLAQSRSRPTTSATRTIAKLIIDEVS